MRPTPVAETYSSLRLSSASSLPALVWSTLCSAASSRSHPKSQGSTTGFLKFALQHQDTRYVFHTLTCYLMTLTQSHVTRNCYTYSSPSLPFIVAFELEACQETRYIMLYIDLIPYQLRQFLWSSLAMRNELHPRRHHTTTTTTGSTLRHSH